MKRIWDALSVDILRELCTGNKNKIKYFTLCLLNPYNGIFLGLSLASFPSLPNTWSQITHLMLHAMIHTTVF